MTYKPIETLKHRKSVILIGVYKELPQAGGRPYKTDPYVGWLENDGDFARWPHPYPPTHFAELPSTKELENLLFED